MEKLSKDKANVSKAKNTKPESKINVDTSSHAKDNKNATQKNITSKSKKPVSSVSITKHV